MSYCICCKFIGLFCCFWVAVAYFSFMALFQVKSEGTLKLQRATDTVRIVREDDTMITHVYANDFNSALYGQGFANAQTRLFSMELRRRAAKGELSELFGSSMLKNDQMMRTAQLWKVANDTVESLSPRVREGLQAYADGVNDYVNNVGIGLWGNSGHILPVEFYAFSIEWTDWEIQDTMAIMRLVSLFMSFSFTSDIMRETFRHVPEIEPMIDELFPFRPELQTGNQWAVVDDDSLQEFGQYSNVTLSDRYLEAYEHVRNSYPPKQYQTARRNLQSEEIRHLSEQNQQDMAAELEEQDDYFDLLNQAMSNSWAVHGNYTESGVPLMANDFHMGADLPGPCTIGELRWGENEFIYGAQMPGLAGVINGRTKYFGWSMTIGLADSSDLWEEQLNDDETQYLVDGEWRNLTKVTYEYKIQGKEPVSKDAFYTHRGLLMDVPTLQKYTGNLELLGKERRYSLGWTMMLPGEKCFEFLFQATECKTVPEAFERMDEDSQLVGGYRGVTVNVIMADNSGNIGYQLLGPVPIRKDKTPFLGLRVLNGRTSAYDWEGDGLQTTPLSDLPRSLNPSKGFIVTANNKQASGYAKHDYGANIWPTPRAERISELIEEKIKAGQKLTFQDMRTIQKDNVDTYGRRFVPPMIQLAEMVKADYPEEDQTNINDMIMLLTGWQGDMSADSVAASVYQFHQSFLANNMLGAWPTSQNNRCKMFEGQYRAFAFEMLGRAITTALEGDYSYSGFCKQPGKEYKQENICAYNIADALIETKKFLSEEISSDSNQWKWGDLVVMKFKSPIWSNVEQLDPYFSSWIVVPGNANTVNVAEFGICKPSLKNPTRFRSGKVSAYNHICTFEEEFKSENNVFGVPGGLNEFPLMGNFDDMIENHIFGDLWQMKQPQDIADPLELVLKPED